MSSGAHAQQQQAQREITKVAGDLYRFQNNFHVSVFLVTPEGVIVTDPMDAEAAAWLREQIGERFDQPIRYAIYSHDHADHIAGGEVFKEAGA
ncbi:MAG TPA: MBL fold metallo-hydrolase, partial [Geminicoccaceae bacterium]